MAHSAVHPPRRSNARDKSNLLARALSRQLPLRHGRRDLLPQRKPLPLTTPCFPANHADVESTAHNTPCVTKGAASGSDIFTGVYFLLFYASPHHPAPSPDILPRVSVEVAHLLRVSDVAPPSIGVDWRSCPLIGGEGEATLCLTQTPRAMFDMAKQAPEPIL